MGRFLLIAFLWFGFFAAAEDNAAHQKYVLIYVAIQEADLLTKDGNTEEGLKRYTEAWHRLQQLKTDFPDWEPTIVYYRIKYVTQKLGTRVPVKAEPVPDKINLQQQSPVKASGSASPTGFFAPFPQLKPVSGIPILEIDCASRRKDIPIHEDKIRQNMKSKKGGPYSLSVVDEDIRNLYAVGDYENVQIHTSEMKSEEGERGVRLTVLVEPKPILVGVARQRMSAEGKAAGQPTLSGEDLRLDTVVVGKPVGGESLHRQAVRWEANYRRQGFSEIRITPKLENQADGTAKVLFQFHEGPRRFIREITFEGNDHVRVYEMKKVIRLQPKLPWLTGQASNYLDPTQVGEDLDRIRDLYQNRGFLDVQVASKAEEIPGGLKMHYQIKEGKRYGVEKITLEGFNFFAENQLLKELRENSRKKEIFDQMNLKMIRVDGLLRGRSYSPHGMQASIQTLQDFYGKHGFRDASVAARILQGEESKKSLRVHFHIHEGEKYYVDKVLIRGNQKIPDAEIRSKILLGPGEPFDGSKETRSKENLLATKFYRDVQTYAYETELSNWQVLVFEVTEEPQKLSFGLGVGYIWDGKPPRGFVLAAPFPALLSFNLSAGWGMAWMQTKKTVQEGIGRILQNQRQNGKSLQEKKRIQE